jgi:RNA polymerase sigma-70 factor, ECF subfamily
MNADLNFKNDLIKTIPNLRAFAISLTGKSDRADDLVQETLMKAWAHSDSFEVGTNLKAWLFTILRNEFYTTIRKRKREVEDVDGKIAGAVGTLPEQHSKLDMLDMQAALQQLPFDQRESLLLVSASGMSYEEAAAICNVAVGTIKSRVNRARMRLTELLNPTNPSGLTNSAKIQAAPISSNS